MSLDANNISSNYLQVQPLASNRKLNGGPLHSVSDELIPKVSNTVEKLNGNEVLVGKECNADNLFDNNISHQLLIETNNLTNTRHSNSGVQQQYKKFGRELEGLHVEAVEYHTEDIQEILRDGDNNTMEELFSEASLSSLPPPEWRASQFETNEYPSTSKIYKEVADSSTGGHNLEVPPPHTASPVVFDAECTSTNGVTEKMHSNATHVDSSDFTTAATSPTSTPVGNPPSTNSVNGVSSRRELPSHITSTSTSPSNRVHRSYSYSPFLQRTACQQPTRTHHAHSAVDSYSNAPPPPYPHFVYPHTVNHAELSHLYTQLYGYGAGTYPLFVDYKTDFSSALSTLVKFETATATRRKRLREHDLQDRKHVFCSPHMSMKFKQYKFGDETCYSLKDVIGELLPYHIYNRTTQTNSDKTVEDVDTIERRQQFEKELINDIYNCTNAIKVDESPTMSLACKRVVFEATKKSIHSMKEMQETLKAQVTHTANSYEVETPSDLHILHSVDPRLSYIPTSQHGHHIESESMIRDCTDSRPPWSAARHSLYARNVQLTSDMHPASVHTDRGEASNYYIPPLMGLQSDVQKPPISNRMGGYHEGLRMTQPVSHLFAT